MKRLSRFAQIHSILIVLGLGTNTAQTISWQQTNGPHGGGTSAIAIESSGTIMAFGAGSSGGGTFVSTSSGDTWMLRDAGLPSNGVMSIAAAGNGVFFVASDQQGVYRTTDEGVSWSSSGFPESNARTVAVGPNGYVYTGTFAPGIVYVSRNSGASWTQSSNGISGATNISSFAFLPIDTVFAGTWYGGVFRSTDLGANWSPVNNTLNDNFIYAVVVTPSGDLFAAGNGVFRTTNRGAEWFTASSGIPPGGVLSLSGSPGGDLYAGTQNNGVYRSTNSGVSWTFFSPGVGSISYSIAALACSPSGTVFAGTGTGLYRSAASGPWPLVGLPVTSLLSVVASPGGAVFAASMYSGTGYRTTNLGATWIPLDYGTPVSTVTCFAARGPNEVFAGTDGTGLFRSTNQGGTWSQISTFPSAASIYQIMAPLGGLILASRIQGGLYRSSDNGASWSLITSGIPGNIINSFAANAGYIFAGFQSNYVYRSTDNGLTWSVLDSGLVTGVTSLTTNSSGDVFAGGGSFFGIYRSTDNGDSWIQVSSGLPTGDVPSLAVDLQGNIYASIFDNASYTNRVFTSTNNGDTWENVSTGLPDIRIASLGVGPTGHLYAATSGKGMYRTLAPTTHVDPLPARPSEFSLQQNYPNPFNPATTISFSLPFTSFVSLRVFDALGREVSVLLSEELPAGAYAPQWNAAGLASGVYFYRLQAASFTETKKLLLLR